MRGSHVWFSSSITSVILPSCPTWHSKNRLANVAVLDPLSLDGTNTMANCAISSMQCTVKMAWRRVSYAAKGQRAATQAGQQSMNLEANEVQQAEILVQKNVSF